MQKEIENWLAGTGATLDNAPDVPRGLYERLKYIAEIISDSAGLPGLMQLAYRLPSGTVSVAPIDCELVVGRKPPADVIIADQRISQRHFRIRRMKSGAWIEDLDSRNGVYVNGRKISGHELRDGDIIEAGGQVFVFLKGA
ncbi:MAG: FHA domain-containing protein [Kiritimatiellia bacterium]